MLIKNGSKHVIAVSDTLEGAVKSKAHILQPGQALRVREILPNVIVEFATTPDGLRCAIREEGIILPTGFNLN